MTLRFKAIAVATVFSIAVWTLVIQGSMALLSDPGHEIDPTLTASTE